MIRSIVYHAMLAALVLLAAPLSAPAQQAEVDARFERVEAYILEAMRERDLPSVAVAIAKDGEVLWERAWGWADRERRVRATPHTMYSLASISKPMTATAILRLVERGEIDLDRPANAYLGEAGLTGLAGPVEGASVRRVLSHTAGLPLHYRFFYDGDASDPPVRPAEAIERYGILVNPPGERYEYSNIGYGVLDQIVEHVSGDALGGFLRREVFGPLGLTRTSVHLPPALEPYAATRYDGDLAPIPYYQFDHDGASAMWSSAHDLVRFGMFHLGTLPPAEDGMPAPRAVLADSTRHEMQRPVEPASYGLGWFVEPDEYGLRSVWHSGSMPGVSTMLRLYPDEDLAVVVLLNTLDRTMRLRIAEELVAAVVPAYAEARAAERERTAGGGPGGQGARDAGAPAAFVGEWQGTLRTYEREVPLRLTIAADGDVHIRLGSQMETVLDGARMTGGRLTGRFAGPLPTPDARRHPHTVALELNLRDGRLAGRATALAGGPPIYFALSSWVELTRRVAAGEGAARP